MTALAISAAELTGLVNAWFWPFARIASVVVAAPVFGNQIVPVRVKLAIALTLTLVIAPVVPDMPHLDPLSGRGLLITAEQVVIGLMLGLSFRLTFIVMEIAGQLIAQLTGLGYAAMVDPANGVNVPVTSQFYIVLTTLVFLGLDGHLLTVQWLVDSFRLLPVSQEHHSFIALESFVQGAGWIFASALALALPAMVSLLTVNMAFGVMTRAAPQLNIFAVGFPITLGLGFAIMWITLPGVLAELPGLFSDGFALSAILLGGP